MTDKDSLPNSETAPEFDPKAMPKPAPSAPTHKLTEPHKTPEVRKIAVKTRPIVPPVESESKPNPLHHDPEANWEYYKYDVYLHPKKRRIPPWVIPLVTFIVLGLIIFVILPKIARKQSTDTTITRVVPVAKPNMYVVKVSVAPLLQSPQARSGRISEGLLGEEVKLVEPAPTNGFFKVGLSDGLVGYMDANHINNTATISGQSKIIKQLLVLDSNKNIVSAASGGTLLQKVYMGTILNLDYVSKGLARVSLPSGGEGWINTEGTTIINPGESIPMQSALVDYFVNTALTFENARYVPNSLTRDGASPLGIAYIAARINGIKLPRQMDMLIKVGTDVKLPTSPLKDVKDLASLKRGDLLFFETNNPATPMQLGIFLGGSKILTVLPNETTIDTTDLMLSPQLMTKLRLIRRFIN